VQAHLGESVGAELVGSHGDARDLAEPVGEREVAAIALSHVLDALDANLEECRILTLLQRRSLASLRSGSEKRVRRRLRALLAAGDGPAEAVNCCLPRHAAVREGGSCTTI
jgi:hypothetical protein